MFAPKPRDYVVKVPARCAASLSKSALTSKLNDGDIYVVDSLTLAEPKTKLMVKFLSNFDLANTTMLVLPGRDETVSRAGGNIPSCRRPT